MDSGMYYSLMTDNQSRVIDWNKRQRSRSNQWSTM